MGGRVIDVELPVTHARDRVDADGELRLDADIAERLDEILAELLASAEQVEEALQPIAA
jgi:hypothetical protein